MGPGPLMSRPGYAQVPGPAAHNKSHKRSHSHKRLASTQANSTRMLWPSGMHTVITEHPHDVAFLRSSHLGGIAMAGCTSCAKYTLVHTMGTQCKHTNTLALALGKTQATCRQSLNALPPELGPPAYTIMLFLQRTNHHGTLQSCAVLCTLLCCAVHVAVLCPVTLQGSCRSTRTGIVHALAAALLDAPSSVTPTAAPRQSHSPRRTRTSSRRPDSPTHSRGRC